MKRKAGREQEAPFFLVQADIKIKNVNVLIFLIWCEWRESDPRLFLGKEI